MESLAGRNSGQWASYDPTNSHETIIGKKEQYNAFRYSAVNLSNDNTVEVRIFRGSIAPAHVFGAIELVSAVRDYARSLTYGDVQSGALAWRHFNAYAHDCRESYPALVERIDERVCA